MLITNDFVDYEDFKQFMDEVVDYCNYMSSKMVKP